MCLLRMKQGIANVLRGKKYCDTQEGEDEDARTEGGV